MQLRFDKQLVSLLDNSKGEILLAISGGVDSMCMAHLALKSSIKEHISIAHMNFNLRGKESDEDAIFVEKFAKQHSIPFYYKSVDTNTFAAKQGASIEMAARKLRYDWFFELTAQHGFSNIAVAHNANDSAETLFLNLLRGTGIKGLCGISKKNGLIIRPLLEFTRQEIEAYAKEHNIEYRTDSTNNETKYHRNRIRNVIFPEFEKINPSFLKTFSTEMGYFSEINSIINNLFEEKKDSFLTYKQNSLEVNTTNLLKDSNFGYWLFKIMEPLGYNQSQIKQVETCLINKSQSGKQFISPDYKGVLGRDTLIFYPIKDTPKPLNYIIKSYLKPKEFNPKGGLYLDATLLGIKENEEITLSESGNIYIRQWKSADRFIPYGMKGEKKVSDYLTSLKLDIEQKSQQNIIATMDSNGKEIILYIAGRTDNRFSITEKTKIIAEIIIY